ncbi:hypothetical protein [Sagittula sp. NFXS13]|uniref:hypothetical protein n=1 Tax=Sagittula sp. NFXS13 TaxID=2819095 RepID=UPI0032DE60DB
MRIWLLILALAVLPFKVAAQERQVLLFSPPALVETGVMSYILPRFKLKTQIAVQLVDDPAQAQVVLGDAGTPVFEGAGQVWAFQVTQPGGWTDRFAGWLAGEIGRDTILSYAPDETAVFRPPPKVAQPVVEVDLVGDPALGLQVSRLKCARCHAVDEDTRLTDIGSTPSFALLRGFADWQARFIGFYALNPHPAFTQIDEVTPPFDAARPSPISPIRMTLEEVEAVLAYVGGLPPADLGAPLQSQQDQWSRRFER